MLVPGLGLAFICISSTPGLTVSFGACFVSVYVFFSCLCVCVCAHACYLTLHCFLCSISTIVKTISVALFGVPLRF